MNTSQSCPRGHLMKVLALAPQVLALALALTLALRE